MPADEGARPELSRLDVVERLATRIAAATSDAIVCADAEGRITFWNAAAQALFGYARDEAVGQSLDLIVPDRLRERHWAGFRRVVQGAAPRHLGKPVGVEARHKSGVEIAVEVSFAAWPEDGGGEAFGIGTIIRDVSERKRVESELERLNAELAAQASARLGEAGQQARALAESEARFRALADNIPQLAWMADADGSIVWYNRRWHEYCGTTPEQMRGWGWEAVHDPRVLPDVLERWRACIATGAPFEMTFPLRGADGVFRPFLTRVRPVRDTSDAEHPEGQVTRWFGTNTDVTESRAAEAANAHLAAIVASTEDAIVSFAPEDGRILTWNKGAERLFGYTEAEMVGGPANRLRPPDLPEDERGGVAAWVMAGRPVVAHETVRVAKGGERIPVSITATRMLAPDGRVMGVSDIFHDLRPRIRAEARLRESEARLRDLLATLDLGTLMARDLDGTVRFWSEGCARLYGWTAAEAVGRSAHELLHTIYPVPRAEVEAALERDGEWTGDLRHRARDGSEVVVAARKVLRRDAEGKPAAVLESLTDVIAQRRTEAALRESEARLRQAQKLEAIGQLAAGVAHDFNNLLQGVTGGIELVLDEVEAGTPAHEFAELALGSARRGSTLTHQLLSYARKQMLQPKLIELAPFLSDMQRLLARTLGPHIAIKARVNGATPPIQADPSQLETAVLNLAINASHAMPRGGTLLLGAQVDSADQERVVIAVTDTGAGMDAATLAQAFEPFFTTKGLDGTGLGLSMVQGFAAQSGGEVRIESAPGKGTTVMLWLPVAQMANNSREQQSVPARLRGSGRLLLVDDVADVLVTASAFLERAGFQVVQAGSGDQALAVLAAGERFDALVTDYAMPGMDGVELIEQARVVQPGLPALLITGFAEVGGADALPEAVAVLRKPFQRQQLVEAVLHALGRDAGRAIGSGQNATVQQ
jgi:PAS domain S-box-containing protein